MQQGQSALLDAVVMASALATRPKMFFWSAGRSLAVAPAPVVLTTTAAAPAAGQAPLSQQTSHVHKLRS